MNIGTTIARLRKEKKLSQTDLADAANLSQTTLSQIENGVSRPNQKTLNAICEKLGVSESLLYVLTIDREDVPESKKQLFDTFYPMITDMMNTLFKEGDSKLT